MTIARRVLKNGLTSYRYRFRYRGRTYRGHLGHNLTLAEARRLDTLTTAVVDAYRTARRQEGAAAHTLNGELATLSLMLHTAASWHELPKSALPVIRWLRVEEQPVRVLSAEEERRLLIAATPHLRPLIVFALHTGLRKRELLTLTWAAIDRARREVTVVGYLAKNRHQRVIPLNHEALRALDEAHSRHGRVFGYRATASVMDRAVKLAQLPGVNLHVLRRSFATRLLHAGVDVDTVRRLLGHRSLSVTQKYLAHSPNVAREAVQLLEIEPRHRVSRLE